MHNSPRYSDGIRVRIEPEVRKAIDELAAREFLRPSELIRRELRRIARDAARMQEGGARTHG